jgi:hypothetical protein
VVCRKENGHLDYSLMEFSKQVIWYDGRVKLDDRNLDASDNR